MTTQEFQRLYAFYEAKRIQQSHNPLWASKREIKHRAGGRGLVLKNSRIVHMVSIEKVWPSERIQPRTK